MDSFFAGNGHVSPSLRFPHYGKQFNESIISKSGSGDGYGTGNRPNEIISSVTKREGERGDGVFNYQIMEVPLSVINYT